MTKVLHKRVFNMFALKDVYAYQNVLQRAPTFEQSEQNKACSTACARTNP